jgi:type IV pilus assembly protein PilN
MVRVNLLPDRKQAKTRTPVAEPGQLWLLVVLGVIALQIIALIVVHFDRQSALKKIVSQNQQIQSEVDGIKRDIANHGEIKAQLKELKDREDAVLKLQAGRTGPTSVLMELSKILTKDRGPTIDRDRLEQMKRDNPTAVMNPNWDVRRVWLTSYNEIERQVKLTGLARDGEDVSELQKRLMLSDYFYDVKLLPGGTVIDHATKAELKRFEFSAKVRY